MKQLKAIIMNTMEIGESDLIITFFTKEKGKMKGIAKGAKRSKRRFFNCLDLFYLVFIELEDQKSRNLPLIHSCKLIEPFSIIRENYEAFVVASYMIELADNLFPIGIPEESMFQLLENSLKMLQKKRDYELILANYEAKAMAIGGYKINLEKCQSCGRIYHGKGNGVFLAHKGGIICFKCMGNINSPFILDPITINTLKLLQSSEIIKDISPNILNKIRKVLALHIAYILGSRLRTKKLIDSIFPLSQVVSRY